MAAQATATGTLGGTPVANLLIYALDRRLTGTLVVEDHRSRKSAILLRGGTPAKVKLPEPVALLSEVLVEAEAMDRTTAESTFEAAHAEQKLHGMFLCERGLVGASAVGEALAEQVARKVVWLCELPPTSVYGYYEGQDFLATFGGAESPPVEPLDIIWRVLKRTATPEGIDSTLARLGDREVRLHPNSRVGRFAFDPKERGLVDVLRARPQPLASLLASGLLPEAQLKRVLYALVVTRHLDLGSAALPVGVHASMSTAPAETRATDPRALGAASEAPNARATGPRPTGPAPAKSVPAPTAAPTGEVAAFIQEIRERTAKIGSQNYYEILGIERGASTALVQAAFFQLAKRWHPDRLGPELEGAREDALRVFARMSEAHQVLMNDEQRLEYERLMKEGGSTADEQEVVQKVLRAASAFQKAEVLVRRGSLEEALKHVEIAVENDGEQAEYVALRADLLSQSPERAQMGNFAELVKIVNDAKKRQPQNVKVRLYRARVLKRAGDVEGAYKEFRSIVERDATNVEAAREVRLHQMRRGKQTTDPKKEKAGGGGAGGKEAGLFGKFWKR